MKLKILKNKAVCWFLLISIIFQSCTVYKRAPVSISEASQTHKRVLVVTGSDKKIRLKRIEKTDSIYYGIKTVKSEEVKIPLNEKDIKKIRVKDQAASTFLTIGSIVLTFGIIIIAVLINDLNNDLNSINSGGKN